MPPIRTAGCYGPAVEIAAAAVSVVSIIVVVIRVCSREEDATAVEAMKVCVAMPLPSIRAHSAYWSRVHTNVRRGHLPLHECISMLDAVATIILAGMMFIPIINLVVGTSPELACWASREGLPAQRLPSHHHCPEADPLASANSPQAWCSDHRLPERTNSSRLSQHA